MVSLTGGTAGVGGELAPSTSASEMSDSHSDSSSIASR
jgi:hypothetical protein